MESDLSIIQFESKISIMPNTNFENPTLFRKGYMFLPLILTQGLLAIEMLVKLVKCTNWDISFKSLILLLARVKFIKLIGKNLSHCTKWFILLLWRYSSWNLNPIMIECIQFQKVLATYFEILQKWDIIYVYYTILW